MTRGPAGRGGRGSALTRYPLTRPFVNGIGGAALGDGFSDFANGSEGVMSGETVQERRARERRERIEASRQALAAQYAANPADVQQFNLRMARITRARKHEEQRFEHLVLGKPRPKVDPSTVKRPAGMSRIEWKGERKRRLEDGARLEPGIEEAMQLRERWSHKQGSPETLDAIGTHSDGLDQLEANGTITKEQKEWAAQIANVHRSIEADVGVRSASLEARVDGSSHPPAIAERIHRVRMHLAYGYWRQLLPPPKGLVLDMIVGDSIGYTVAAKRYRVHNRKAKRLLLEAIQRWPACVAAAFSIVNQADVDAMNDARRPAGVGAERSPVVPIARGYESARADETGRDRTDEPFLLPAVDPAFLDDRGLLRQWSEIADIIRERVCGAIEGNTAQEA